MLRGHDGRDANGSVPRSASLHAQPARQQLGTHARNTIDGLLVETATRRQTSLLQTGSQDLADAGQQAPAIP